MATTKKTIYKKVKVADETLLKEGQKAPAFKSVDETGGTLDQTSFIGN